MPTQEEFAAMGAFNEELVRAGVMEAGEGLHPSSRGARVAFSGKDRRVRHGPCRERGAAQRVGKDVEQALHPGRIVVGQDPGEPLRLVPRLRRIAAAALRDASGRATGHARPWAPSMAAAIPSPRRFAR
jgi:hypothetical protein